MIVTIEEKNHARALFLEFKPGTSSSSSDSCSTYSCYGSLYSNGIIVNE